MKILAIDTVTESCSVALYLPDTCEQRLEIAPQGHSRLALNMARALLKQHALELPELDAIAVDIGPGSFTGVRIGLGIAQGLAYGANLPVIAVGSLETLAHSLSESPQSQETPKAQEKPASPAITPNSNAPKINAQTLILPAIDARMQQVYYALHRPLPKPQNLIPPSLTEPTRILENTPPEQTTATHIIGIGSGWDRYAPTLSHAITTATATATAATATTASPPQITHLPERYPEARTLAHLATTRGLPQAISPLHLNACYIRDQVTHTPPVPTTKPKK